MKKVSLILLRLACSGAVLYVMYYLYGLFPPEDWQPDLEKFIAYFAFFAAIVGFTYLRFKGKAPRAALWAEGALFVVVLAVVVYGWSGKWAVNGFGPPVADYGFMVVDATKMLFVEHENPYSSQTISPIRDTLGPEFRGYYYGPLTMIGYSPSLLWPVSGYKIAGVFYLLATAVLLGLLVWEPDDDPALKFANIAFVLAAYFLPERMWVELFSRGAHDFMPTALVLGALLAIKKNNFFAAGLLAGLSFSTKFAPALFLLPFLPIRRKNMWIGFALGLLPQVPFLLWDLQGFINNVYLVRFFMPSDQSSLRYYLKPEHYWWLPAALAVAMTIAAYRNLRRPLGYGTVLIGFALVMIVGEVTFKQVHLNHMVWFYPIFALIFTYSRDRLFGLATQEFSDRSAAT